MSVKSTSCAMSNENPPASEPVYLRVPSAFAIAKSNIWLVSVIEERYEHDTARWPSVGPSTTEGCSLPSDNGFPIALATDFNENTIILEIE